MVNRLHSLFSLPFMETADDIKMAGISLRSLRSGMHPSGNNRRRKLLLEGRSLIAYIFQKSPQLWIYHVMSELLKIYATASH